jgi:hypothetical protein
VRAAPARWRALRSHSASSCGDRPTPPAAKELPGKKARRRGGGGVTFPNISGVISLLSMLRRDGAAKELPGKRAGREERGEGGEAGKMEGG